MGAETGQDMVAVLPDRFGHHQGCIYWYTGENGHSHTLAIDEPMTFDRVVNMGPVGGPPEVGQSGGQGPFQLLLRRPTGCVRRLAQVAAGNEPNGLGL